ncbi:MAG: hypothetical protein JG767_1414 [Deferribacteraceae bacterium]|nr:hypothetical protein [Deferribacteraceae bacterium]
MKFTDKVFFYGQLKSDGLFFPLYRKYVLNIEKGYTFGSLYEYKKRPVFIPSGNNKVFGEIITLFNTRKVFSIFDSIEYYLKRILTDVYREPGGKLVKANIYIFENVNNETLIPIESGLWINKK